MYMDAQARPSNGQVVTGAAGTYVSTDSIDLLTAIDNPGRSGTPLRAKAVVTTAFAGGTSIQAQLISSVNSNLSSPSVLASGPVVALANLAAGANLLDVPLPDISDRYLGFQYVTLGTMSAGAVTAGIVGGTDRNSTVIPMNTGL
jgi:hypothetical protein